MTRVCRVPSSSDRVMEGRDFHLPVFAFVFTKFRKMPGAKLVNIDICFVDFNSDVWPCHLWCIIFVFKIFKNLLTSTQPGHLFVYNLGELVIVEEMACLVAVCWMVYQLHSTNSACVLLLNCVFCVVFAWLLLLLLNSFCCTDLYRKCLVLELILICTFRSWSSHILKTSPIDLIQLMHYLRL